ncbi:MAG: peptidase MA family metallohydrolase [Anaerolineales bacterium]|nr:peptidase MA family metallohydrolase [Anaerolineales bacterium]
MRAKLATFFLLFGMLTAPLQTASALPRADVQNDQVAFDFPNTATFSATLSANAKIVSVTLEYGDEQLTCGDVIAKAYPQFTSANTVQAEWMWDMRQSGSLPPGAQIWWRWRYVDSSGAEFVSEQKSATWLDNIHDWQNLASDNLRVHWYGNDAAFGQTMLDAGVEGLRRNKDQAGLAADAPIDLFVYPNYNDMKDAILYEPSWTGGMAFPEHNVVIMGISSSDTTWDKNTVIHELTHVLIGHFTFSCIGSVPTWLNEGLAMFSEGELDAHSQAQLDQAVSDNSLFTVRSLSGGFSELSDKANLSYSESYSIVKFLISAYGQEKMTQLLSDLRDAKPIDDALNSVYGFDTDGLEDAWREAIHAAPRAASAQPTAMPTPTYVPTYVPMSGAPLAVTPTPYAIPTSSSGGTSDQPKPNLLTDTTFLTLTSIMLCACCLTLLVIGVFVFGFIVRKNNAKAKGENNA